MSERKFSKKQVRKSYLKYLDNVKATRIVQKNKQQPTPVNGIRKQVLETYYSEGILAAYKVLEEYNKKFAEPIYTREIFEMWINEENKRNKSQEKDNGCYR